MLDLIKHGEGYLKLSVLLDFKSKDVCGWIDADHAQVAESIGLSSKETVRQVSRNCVTYLCNFYLLRNLISHT